MKGFAIRMAVVCLLGSIACSLRVDGAQSFQSGVNISKAHPLAEEHLKTLLEGLKFWTGFTGLAIDAAGKLTVNDRSNFNKGSKTARELLIAAVDSKDSLTISSHDNSPTIAFSQVEPTDLYFDALGKRHEGWQLRIDFADYKTVKGSNSVLVSFDPTINILHELAHSVFGYFDLVDDSDLLGECEKYINTMRLELGLPQRLHYYPDYRKVRRPDGFHFLQGELRFNSVNGESQEELLLTFDVDTVFDLSNAKSRAAIEAGLMAQKLKQQRSGH